MEGGVEHGHLGHVAHDGLAGVDAGDVGGVVEGGQGNALGDGGHDVLVDQHRVGKLLAAVDDAVTHGADLPHALDHAVLLAGQLIQHGGNGLGVGGHGHVLVEHGLAVLGLVGQVAVDADALAQTLGQELLALHVQQLVLQRGGAAVDNKNFHKSFPLFSKV